MDNKSLSASRPNAWVLDFGPGLRAAVGTRVLLQITDHPALHNIPCTPAHCRSVFSWQSRLLPVMDMAAALGGAPLVPHLLVVAGYVAQPGAPTSFGALLLASPPVAVIAGDEQACSLPEHPAGWSEFAISCFGHRGDAIPVLHLGRVFSAVHPADYSG